MLDYGFAISRNVEGFAERDEDKTKLLKTQHEKAKKVPLDHWNLCVFVYFVVLLLVAKNVVCL